MRASVATGAERAAALPWRRDVRANPPRGPLVAARRRPRARRAWAATSRWLDGASAGSASTTTTRRVALVGRRAGRVLAVGLGPLRASDRARPPGRRPRRRRGCPAPAGSPARTLNYAEHALRAARARRRTTSSSSARSQTREPVDADRGRAARRRRALPGGPAAPRRRARRPGRRVPAEHPRGDRRASWPPRRLGAIWSSCAPGVRHPGRRRPVRPDRADGAARRRRLPLRRQGRSTGAAEVAEIRAALPTLAVDRRACRTSTRAGAVAAVPGAIAWADAARRAGAARLRAGPVRPPAVRPLLLGHDRPAEADRPRPRRHPPRAPQGARRSTRTSGRPTGSSGSPRPAG